MKDLIHQAVDSVFQIVHELTYPMMYVVVKKDGFNTDRSEFYQINPLIVENESDSPTYGNDGRVISHDLTILFQPKTLPVKPRYGDEVIFNNHTYTIKEPISYDPVFASVTLFLTKVG